MAAIETGGGPCPKCANVSLGPEWFTYTLPDGREFHWDTRKAKALAKCGPQSLFFDRAAGKAFPVFQAVAVVPLDQLAIIVDNYDYYACHLDHVNPDQPGFAVVIDFGLGQGPETIMIDGAHRAAVCLRLGREFEALVLSNEAEIVCRMAPAAVAKERAKTANDPLRFLV